MITRECELCGIQFNIHPSKCQRYCSVKCRYQSRRGKPAWNSGLHGWQSESHRANLMKSITGKNPKRSEAMKGSKNHMFGKPPQNLPTGENHHNWKGGRKRTRYGYIYKLAHGHPRSTKNGYVLEHILVMEEYLGRLLDYEGGERVHHCNHIKDDNRIENLELT